MIRQRRKFARIEFTDPIDITLENQTRRSFSAKDISLEGISIYTDESFVHQNKSVELSFTPPKEILDDAFDIHCRVTGRVMEHRIEGNGKEYCAIKFDQNLSKKARSITEERKKIVLFAIPAILAGLLGVKFVNIQYFWYHPFMNAFGLTAILYLLSRFFIAYFYKPAQAIGYFPTVSFVIPVHGHDTMLAKTVESCFHSTYRKDKMEIIVVHDKSSPAMAQRLKSLKEKNPYMTVIHPRGEKSDFNSLAAGVKQAKGEIVVFVESGSMVDKHAVYYLVQGFKDQTVGAICGNVSVYNTNSTTWTKMQDVMYFICNTVFKAAESVFGNVTYCVGGLSGFRREYIREALNHFKDQTFLGQPIRLGAYRSLTRHVLKNYRTLYDARAKAKKIVAEEKSLFLNKQLDWQKSFFIENLKCCRFMWCKHPAASYSFYIGLSLILLSPIVFLYNFIYQPLMHRELPIIYLAGILLISSLFSIFYFFKKPNDRWVYGYALCLFCLIQVCLQSYYTIFLSVKGIIHGGGHDTV